MSYSTCVFLEYNMFVSNISFVQGTREAWELAQAASVSQLHIDMRRSRYGRTSVPLDYRFGNKIRKGWFKMNDPNSSRVGISRRF